jgi:hypothetical protein
VENARIEEVYRETDVLVLPSVWPENQPVCLTEAMASRTAVIASRMGGIPELIENGHNGFLFEPGDADALARCMSELIRDPARAIAFGEDGFRRIADKTLANQVAQIARIYRRPVRPSAPDGEESGRVLFACAGHAVDLQCALAMNALSRQGDPRWRFVMADWLDDAQLAGTTALWVVCGAAYRSSCRRPRSCTTSACTAAAVSTTGTLPRRSTASRISRNTRRSGTPWHATVASCSGDPGTCGRRGAPSPSARSRRAQSARSFARRPTFG